MRFAGPAPRPWDNLRSRNQAIEEASLQHALRRYAVSGVVHLAQQSLGDLQPRQEPAAPGDQSVVNLRAGHCGVLRADAQVTDSRKEDPHPHGVSVHRRDDWPVHVVQPGKGAVDQLVPSSPPGLVDPVEVVQVGATAPRAGVLRGGKDEHLNVVRCLDRVHETRDRFVDRGGHGVHGGTVEHGHPNTVVVHAEGERPG